jgi:hypothetical protein
MLGCVASKPGGARIDVHVVHGSSIGAVASVEVDATRAGTTTRMASIQVNSAHFFDSCASDIVTVLLGAQAPADVTLVVTLRDAQGNVLATSSPDVVHVAANADTSVVVRAGDGSDVPGSCGAQAGASGAGAGGGGTSGVTGGGGASASGGAGGASGGAGGASGGAGGASGGAGGASGGAGSTGGSGGLHTLGQTCGSGSDCSPDFPNCLKSLDLGDFGGWHFAWPGGYCTKPCPADSDCGANGLTWTWAYQDLTVCWCLETCSGHASCARTETDTSGQVYECCYGDLYNLPVGSPKPPGHCEPYAGASYQEMMYCD